MRWWILLLFLSSCTTESAIYGDVPSHKDAVVGAVASVMALEPMSSEMEAPVVSNDQPLITTVTHPIVYINITGNKFDPDESLIYEGTEVVWVNRDETSHRISGARFHSNTLGWAQFFSHRFMDEGNYPYDCELHEKQNAIIHVLPAAPKIDKVDPDVTVVHVTQQGYVPQSIRIPQFGVVLWINDHPVSSVTVSGAGFDSGSIKRGGRFFHEFNKQGIYPYGSTNQQNLYGNVTVVYSSK